MNNIRRTAVVAIVVFAAVSLTHTFTGAETNTATSTAPLRHYYLTKATVNGNNALTACATGYHFASFAEISDPNVITYNQTLGRSLADDGSGPPSAVPGWIRTGFISNSDPSNSSSPTNCSVWTSGNSTDSGEIAVFDGQLGQNNGNSAFPILLFLNNKKCDNSDGASIGVWCVQN